MLDKLKHALFFPIVCFVVFCGGRAAEWLIPAPEARILVCFEYDVEMGNTCHSLKDLVEAKKKRQGE